MKKGGNGVNLHLCSPATSMFMTNIMLLWWTSDSVPLPTWSSRKLWRKLCFI